MLRFKVLFLILFISFQVMADQRLGYFLKLPNRFWPNTIDTAERDYSTFPSDVDNHFLNPDVFCEHYDARLPSVAEFDLFFIGYGPFSKGQPGGLEPFHPSHYIDEDINKPLKTKKVQKMNEPAVGALVNEWGHLFDHFQVARQYKVIPPQVALPRSFLVTEPFDTRSRGVYSNDVYSSKNLSYSSLDFINKTNQFYTIFCVVDNVE